LGFWNFFRNKKNEDSDEIESPISKDDTSDVIFAKNFTSFGGRFIFIDEKNSTNEVFQKIIEENQWSNDNVC
jgi:ABC-type proline/glycine betaine transport system substrate-binding protein